MKARNADLSHLGWIATDDRMPRKSGREILAYSRGHRVSIATGIAVHDMGKACGAKPNFYSHWMPLPRPRKVARAPLEGELTDYAWKYVWRIHGRGLSTSVGVHTRRLLAKAFEAGYRSGRRARP